MQTLPSYEEDLEHKIHSLHAEIDGLKDDIDTCFTKASAPHFELETLTQAMALFVTFVEETHAEPAAKADAYKQMLIDIADETWCFPPPFQRWRCERGV